MTDPIMAPQTDPYRQIDELYDAEHASFDDDVDLYLAMAKEVDGPILELGCGTGRILVPLANAGAQVTGIDSSPVMLRRARQALASLDDDTGVQLANLDMRNADQAPGGPFALVIYSLNGLMHLDTQAGQIASLRSVGKSLADGGMVLIDIMNPSPDYLEQIAGAALLEWTGQSADGSVIQKWAHREIDVHAQSIETRLWYDLTSVSGELNRLHTGFTLRYLHLAELSLMLREAGFGEPTAYGSYQLDPLDSQSERMIVTAEKQA